MLQVSSVLFNNGTVESKQSLKKGSNSSLLHQKSLGLMFIQTDELCGHHLWVQESVGEVYLFLLPPNLYIRVLPSDAVSSVISLLSISVRTMLDIAAASANLQHLRNRSV